MLNWVIIALLITLISSTPAPLVWNFKIRDRGNTYEAMMRNRLEIEVFIGTPEQRVILEIEPSTSFTWVLDSTTSNNKMDHTFDSTKSTSLTKQKCEKPIAFWRHQVRTGFEFSDFIRISDLKINATMVIPETVKVFTRRGVIGLLKEQHEDYVPSLITQYQKNNIVKDYQFTIEYKTPTTGIAIIGKQNPKDEKAHLVFTTPYTKDSSFDSFILFGNNIQFNEKTKPIIGCTISIDETFGFIIAPPRNKKLIEETYNLKDPMCQEHEQVFDQGLNTFRTYYYYLCENAFVEKTVPTYGKMTVQFNHKKNDLLVLEKESLFQDYSATHKIFTFTIKQGELRNHDWVFGAPILKKYKVVFDLSDVTISFLSYDTQYKKSEMMNIFAIISIITIFFVITYGIIISSLIIKNKIKKRKECLINKTIDYEYQKSENIDVIATNA